MDIVQAGHPAQLCAGVPRRSMLGTKEEHAGTDFIVPGSYCKSFPPKRAFLAMPGPSCHDYELATKREEQG